MLPFFKGLRRLLLCCGGFAVFSTLQGALRGSGVLVGISASLCLFYLEKHTKQ